MKEGFIFVYHHATGEHSLQTRDGEFVAEIPQELYTLARIDKLKIFELLEAVHERAFSLGQQDARRKAAQENVPTWGEK